MHVFNRHGPCSTSMGNSSSSPGVSEGAGRAHRTAGKDYSAAVDIETSTKNGRGSGLVGIGLVVTKHGTDGVVLARSWYVKGSWEAVENKEFWQGNMPVWELSQRIGTDEKTAIDDFAATWRSLAEKLGTTEECIALISDNPEFDFGVLSHYLEKYGHQPMRWTRDGSYRSIKNLSDVSEYLYLDDLLEKTAAQRGVIHNHDPEADAQYHIHVYNRMNELRPRLRAFARKEFIKLHDEDYQMQKRDRLVCYGASVALVASLVALRLIVWPLLGSTAATH